MNRLGIFGRPAAPVSGGCPVVRTAALRDATGSRGGLVHLRRFPHSALSQGGADPEQCKLAGTYYTSLGIAGRAPPCGDLFALDDLRAALDRGHELGCHTSRTARLGRRRHRFRSSVRHNAGNRCNGACPGRSSAPVVSDQLSAPGNENIASAAIFAAVAAAVRRSTPARSI